MDPYTNNTYEQEIDLKDLMFSVLRRWRPIIIIAVVFALLLGGFKTFKGIQQLSDEEFVKENQEIYAFSLEQHATTKKRLEREVKNIQDNIQSQQQYKENSILMNINPYDEYVATATLYISTDYQIMPGMVYQNPNSAAGILKAYMSIAQNGEMYNYVLGKMNNKLSLRYLKELVKLEPDYGNNMLTISVVGDTEKRSSEVMGFIMDSINSSHDIVVQSIGEHQVNIVDDSEYVAVDMELDQKQKDFSNTVEQLDISLQTKTKELADLEEPSNALLSKTSVLKSSVKYAFLGGVLGAFMAVFFICVAFLMSDKLVNEKEIRRRYGIMVLGVFKKNGKKKPFAFVDRWLDKMEGISEKEMEDGQTLDVIAANALNYAEGANRILLVGTIDKASMDTLQNGLSDRFPTLSLAVGGNPCKDAQAIKEAASCDAVIVVEKRNASLFSSIEQELSLIKSLNKKILGCVVL